MYWTNSIVTKTGLDAVDTSNASNQSQYPQLSATEIEKVLILSGMTDAGRFEAIIANTDTAGLLAMFGMSYAELKEILALPDDGLASAPEKDPQISSDKAITALPENLSPTAPIPATPDFLGVEQALPILSKTDTQTVHIDHSSAMLPVALLPVINPGSLDHPEVPATPVDVPDTILIQGPTILNHGTDDDVTNPKPIVQTDPATPHDDAGAHDIAPLTIDAQDQAGSSEDQASEHGDDPAISASNLPIPLAPAQPVPVPMPAPGPVVVIPEPVLPPAPGPVVVVPEPVLPPASGPVVVIPEPVLPPAPGPVVVVPEPVLPPAPGTVVVIPEPVLPPAPGPVVVVPEPVLPPAPGPVVVVPEPVLPPASGPVVVVPEATPQPAQPISPTQPQLPVDGAIETGPSGTGQAGVADGGSGFAGGTEMGGKTAAGEFAKGSSTSSGSIGVGLNGSVPGLMIGSESMGVVVGIATGSVAHSISSGDFGFSFGGGGGGGSRNRQDDRDTRNDTGGPGTTPLPPIIQIGHTPPDTNVHEIINNPPAPVLPLPPVELPGPGAIDGFIIDGVIDAVNQHGGGSDQGGQDNGQDGGNAHDNAPAPAAPPVDGNANVNGANAFIAYARAAITRMQAATDVAHALVDEAADRYHDARHAINEAQDVIDEIDTMVDQGVDFISTDYDRLERANAAIERWTTILNTTNTLINDKQVFINQQTTGINIMRALIDQTRAQLIEWGMQAGIADANANLDNAAGEDAANGGHAEHFDEDVDIVALPDGGNDGLNHADDQPDQAPAPVDDPDADLPPNIVIANEVIAQGNALIDALRAHVALRQTDIAQNETQIFGRQNDITWLQDSRIAGVEHASNQDGIPLSGPDLTNWLRSVITNAQAQISEARADLDRALNDIAQLQAQIAHAQAEIDAWFHQHQNDAPGEHLLPDAPQVIAPVDGALRANAMVHQDDAPAAVQNTAAGLPPAYITAAYAHIADAHAEIAELEALIDETEMDFDVADNRSHQIQEIITAERHAMADLIDNLNHGVATNDQTAATLAEIEAIIANIAQGQTFANDAQTDIISAETIVQRAQAAIRHQEAVIAQSEAVIAGWQGQPGHAGAPANGQVSQAVPPPQNISLALVPAAQTQVPAPAADAAVQAPLPYGTGDLMTPSSVLLAFEFSPSANVGEAAGFIQRGKDIHAMQDVLAHWMGRIDPGFATTLVAFDIVDLRSDGSIQLRVLAYDMPVIPAPATLMALQNAMQDYLATPLSVNHRTGEEVQNGGGELNAGNNGNQNADGLAVDSGTLLLAAPPATASNPLPETEPVALGSKITEVSPGTNGGGGAPGDRSSAEGVSTPDTQAQAGSVTKGGSGSGGSAHGGGGFGFGGGGLNLGGVGSSIVAGGAASLIVHSVSSGDTGVSFGSGGGHDDDDQASDNAAPPVPPNSNTGDGPAPLPDADQDAGDGAQEDGADDGGGTGSGSGAGNGSGGADDGSGGDDDDGESTPEESDTESEPAHITAAHDRIEEAEEIRDLAQAKINQNGLVAPELQNQIDGANNVVIHEQANIVEVGNAIAAIQEALALPNPVINANQATITNLYGAIAASQALIQRILDARNALQSSLHDIQAENAQLLADIAHQQAIIDAAQAEIDAWEAQQSDHDGSDTDHHDDADPDADGGTSDTHHEDDDSAHGSFAGSGFSTEYLPENDGTAVVSDSVHASEGGHTMAQPLRPVSVWLVIDLASTPGPSGDAADALAGIVQQLPQVEAIIEHWARSTTSLVKIELQGFDIINAQGAAPASLAIELSVRSADQASASDFLASEAVSGLRSLILASLASRTGAQASDAAIAADGLPAQVDADAASPAGIAALLSSVLDAGEIFGTAQADQTEAAVAVAVAADTSLDLVLIGVTDAASMV